MQASCCSNRKDLPAAAQALQEDKYACLGAAAGFLFPICLIHLSPPARGHWRVVRGSRVRVGLQRVTDLAVWEQSPTPCNLPPGDVVLETEPRAACRVSGCLWFPSSSPEPALGQPQQLCHRHQAPQQQYLIRKQLPTAPRLVLDTRMGFPKLKHPQRGAAPAHEVSG